MTPSTKYQAWIVVKRAVRDFSPNEERRGTPYHIRGQVLFSHMREEDAKATAKHLGRRNNDFNFWAMPQTAF